MVELRCYDSTERLKPHMRNETKVTTLAYDESQREFIEGQMEKLVKDFWISAADEDLPLGIQVQPTLSHPDGPSWVNICPLKDHSRIEIYASEKGLNAEIRHADSKTLSFVLKGTKYGYQIELRTSAEIEADR